MTAIHLTEMNLLVSIKTQIIYSLKLLLLANESLAWKDITLFFEKSILVIIYVQDLFAFLLNNLLEFGY